MAEYKEFAWAGVSGDALFPITKALAMATPEELAEELLKRVNPDWRPGTDHSKDTPKRFVRSLTELCAPVPEWDFTTFPAESDEMVTLGPVSFYTLCAHHVVPFYGNVWLGYVPGDLLCGLSKLARAVRHCAKGMHVQENLTASIHDFLEGNLEPRGIAIVVKAEHMCMSMRGIQVAGAITTTSKMSGVFGDHSKTAKAEFLNWIGG
jgi:GTP cyclohydrolase I